MLLGEREDLFLLANKSYKRKQDGNLSEITVGKLLSCDLPQIKMYELFIALQHYSPKDLCLQNCFFSITCAVGESNAEYLAEFG